MCDTERLGKVEQCKAMRGNSIRAWRSGSASALGADGRGFKSRRPDHFKISRGHSSAGEHRLCTATTWVRFPLAPPRRDGRAADCGGLENRRRFTPSGGSNPPPSAMCCFTGPANLVGSPGAAGQMARPSLRMAGGVSCHAAGRFHRGGGLSFSLCSRSPWRAGESR